MYKTFHYNLENQKRIYLKYNIEISVFWQTFKEIVENKYLYSKKKNNTKNSYILI